MKVRNKKNIETKILKQLDAIPDENDSDSAFEKAEETQIENDSTIINNLDSSPITQTNGSKIVNELTEEEIEIENLKQMIHGDEMLRNYSDAKYNYGENHLSTNDHMDEVIIDVSMSKSGIIDIVLKNLIVCILIKLMMIGQ